MFGAEMLMIDKIRKATPRQIIEERRKELIAHLAGRYSNWDKDIWGPTLLETPTEEVYEKDHDVSDKITCALCGKKWKIDEKFIRLEFSFCDEYNCGMSICSDCPKIREVVAQC